jgi:hypothetical protein
VRQTTPASADNPRPRAWARPDEVDPASQVAQQLTLIDALINGSLPGPDFARAWLAARRESLNAGERLREPFDRALNEVFYAIEDYVIDPELREPGDMSDDDLVDRVAIASELIQDLNH